MSTGSVGGSSLRKSIQKKFKIRGYALKVDALEEILSFVNRYQDAEEEALELLLDHLLSEHRKLGVKSSIIDKELVSRAVSSLLEADEAVEENPSSVSPHSALRVIDAFSIPKYCYHAIKKQFHQHVGRLPIQGDASAKSALYRDRFLLLLQRVQRLQHFSKPAFDSDISDCGSCEIAPIQSLVGKMGTKWVMGLISQLEDGHFFLEDLTASVEIDFSKAISFKLFPVEFKLITKQDNTLLIIVLQFHIPSSVFYLMINVLKSWLTHMYSLITKYKITTGFISENTIVVAEGEMLVDGIFQVKSCGFPPLEDREKSLKALGGHDFFGGGTLSKEEAVSLLADLEKRAVNDMFVVLYDIWLDDEEVMKKLETVLDGFESQEVVPSLFVFMGNFCSLPCNLSFHSMKTLRVQFGKLGQMISAHTRLKDQSRFLFIPGPDDAGPSTALPRCPLPKYLTEELRSHIPSAIFSTNPCRIKFYTQEIVFFCHDLQYRMRRSCLIPPSTEETDDDFKHVCFSFTSSLEFASITNEGSISFCFRLQLVATITHQSHLCPLPLIVQPVIWNYDHSLHLYPSPHTIVLGDNSSQKEFKYTDITCFNPGSFSNDSTFVAYRPCTQEVELSAL
ncbi:DNA polymerase epsilon subunit B [Linum perenne]